MISPKIMTGEDWNTIMYDGIESAGGPKSVWGILASLYFVALVIIGDCILYSYKTQCKPLPCELFIILYPMYTFALQNTVLQMI